MSKAMRQFPESTRIQWPRIIKLRATLPCFMGGFLCLLLFNDQDIIKVAALVDIAVHCDGTAV